MHSKKEIETGKQRKVIKEESEFMEDLQEIIKTQFVELKTPHIELNRYLAKHTTPETLRMNQFNLKLEMRNELRNPMAHQNQISTLFKSANPGQLEAVLCPPLNHNSNSISKLTPVNETLCLSTLLKQSQSNRPIILAQNTKIDWTPSKLNNGNTSNVKSQNRDIRMCTGRSTPSNTQRWTSQSKASPSAFFHQI